jgi:DNA-binding GntR family transcriptional regulator
VYDAISEMIISRELQPGEHLRENELAAQLGVSRQPVREALQKLQNEGWVDLRPALGAFVHVPTEEEADQLLGVRALLEAESARLAARNATADDVDRLRQLQRAGEDALAAQNAEGMVDANAELHAHIVGMSQNKVLADHIGIIDRRVRWYYTPIARLRGRESWDEHAEIIETIAEGKARRARDLMQRHTEHTRATYAKQQRESTQQ